MSKWIKHNDDRLQVSFVRLPSLYIRSWTILKKKAHTHTHRKEYHPQTTNKTKQKHKNKNFTTKEERKGEGETIINKQDPVWATVVDVSRTRMSK